MQQRLRQELIEGREKITKLTQNLNNAEKRNLKLIAQYTKQKVARTVHANIVKMAFPEQTTRIKDKIEATFQNIADGFDPEIEKIINSKIQEIKDYFVGQIQLISHHNETLRQNVALMEAMNKEGIKFADMDTERLTYIPTSR